MNKKVMIGLTAFIILVLGGIFLITYFNEKEPEIEITDAEQFKKDYPKVDEDNVFVYKNADEVINILEKGTGVVYLGFKECSWCQEYVIYLNEAAKEAGIDKIYYFDILNDRADSTDDYKKILELIGDHLQNDEEGNPRVFVPDVSVVKDGEMIGHDYETSKDTKGIENAPDYWTEKRIDSLKDNLEVMFTNLLDKNFCSTCN